MTVSPVQQQQVISEVLEDRARRGLNTRSKNLAGYAQIPEMLEQTQRANDDDDTSASETSSTSSEDDLDEEEVLERQNPKDDITAAV